jgi:adiponectin receptor
MASTNVPPPPPVDTSPGGLEEAVPAEAQRQSPPATPPEEAAHAVRALVLEPPPPELSPVTPSGDEVTTTLLAIDSLINTLAPRQPTLASRLRAAVSEAGAAVVPTAAAAAATAAARGPTSGQHKAAPKPHARPATSPVCGAARARAREKATEAKKRASSYVRSLDAEQGRGLVAGHAGLGDVIVQLDAVAPWEDIEAGSTKQLVTAADGLQLAIATTLPRTGKTRRPRQVAPRAASPDSTPRCSACPDQHFQTDFWQRGRWAPELLQYDDLPEWRKAQANELIRKGYRQETRSYKECLRSWLYLHNESFNIHSHLWPAVAILPVAALATVRDMQERGAPAVDVLMCLPFFIGAFGCLFLSAMFHTMYECCERSGSCWSKLDYIGITLLIYGSNWPCVHFMFFCEPGLQFVYLAGITVLCIPTMIVVVADRFAGEEFKALRAVLFSALGLTALAPVLHFSLRPGLPMHPNVFWTYLVQMIIMGSCYLFGALLYALSMPERLCPGKLDYIGNAHNLFHILVLAGVVMTFSAFSVLFDEVEANGFEQVCLLPGGL